MKPRVVPRLVLDTNVWLDWLVFDDRGIVPIRNAAGTGRVEIYIDAVCEEELALVLARGFAKRPALDERAQAACIAQCRRIAKRIDTAAPAPHGMLPACRDPDDQKFLEAALAAGARFLVTKDRALLEVGKRKALGRALPFRILTPVEFRRLQGIVR